MIDCLEQIDRIDFHFKEDLFRKRLVAWYQKNHRPLPWRERWRQSRDPYTVWVSEIMLQQTVIKAVLPAYDRFLSLYPSIKSLASASEEDVRLASRGLGYYRRFRMLREAAIYLNSNPDKIWPKSFEEWKLLPGIGDYTAAAISSICFNDPTPVVDGNVERVFCRIWDIRLPPNLPRLKREFFKLGRTLIHKKAPGDFNQGLMELGQTVCTKQKPDCLQCPVQDFCKANASNSQNLAPKAKEKASYDQVQLGLIIPTHKGKFGIIKRPGDSKFLKETWGFPTIFLDSSEFRWDGQNPKLSLELDHAEPIGDFKHSITKHKITAKVFRCGRLFSTKFRWLKKSEVEENLVSNLDRKAWSLQNRI